MRRPGEELGRQVAGGDDRARGRGRNGSIARARGDVEYAIPGPHPAGPHQLGSKRRDQFRRDSRVVARRPQRSVFGLELPVRTRVYRCGLEALLFCAHLVLLEVDVRHP